jgi:hypothetical protein
MGSSSWSLPYNEIAAFSTLHRLRVAKENIRDYLIIYRSIGYLLCLYKSLYVTYDDIDTV